MNNNRFVVRVHKIPNDAQPAYWVWDTEKKLFLAETASPTQETAMDVIESIYGDEPLGEEDCWVNEQGEIVERFNG